MMGVGAPTEFSLDSVRQLMLAHGGRVTNHDLVKSFRKWLTDPVIKEQSRLQFKDYVNTLATIKQEDGEKYLVLKRKYFPEYYADRANKVAVNPKQYQEFYTNNPDKIYDPTYGGSGGGLIPQPGGGYMPCSPPTFSSDGSPSLMDEVMASFTPPSRSIGRQQSSLASSSQPSSLTSSLQPTAAASSYHSSNRPNSISNSIPSNQPQQQYHNNNAQYSAGHSNEMANSYIQRQQHNSDHDLGACEGYQQQSSQDLRFPTRQSSRDLNYPQSYQRQSSQDLGYNKEISNDLNYHRKSSQDLGHIRRNPQNVTNQRHPTQDLNNVAYKKSNAFTNQRNFAREPNNPTQLLLDSNTINPDAGLSSLTSSPASNGFSGETGLYSAYDQGRSSKDHLTRSAYDDSSGAGGAYSRQSATSEYRTQPGDDDYNPGAFSAHFNPNLRQSVSSLDPTSRQSVSSLASLTSSGSYHGSPRSSYATAPSQPNCSSRNPSLGSVEPRQITKDVHGLTDGYLAYTAGLPRGSVSSPDQSGRKNAPPPYRPPPADPPLPPRPSSSKQTSASMPYRPPSEAYHSPPPPMDRRNSYAASVSSSIGSSDLSTRLDRPGRLDIDPPDLGLPPTPPRRPGEANPPPLPRRPAPLGGESNEPANLVGGRHQSSIKNQKDLPELGLPLSLSKSYGNLNLEDNKENRLAEAAGGSLSVDNLTTDTAEEEGISVRERTKTFNRMASETEISAAAAGVGGAVLKASIVKRRNSRAVDFGSRRGSSISTGRDDDSQDTASITTLDPTIKSWMIQVSKGDYHSAARMLMDEPKLARNKDFTTGYTGLHWAAKYGNLDMIKLLAGTYNANPNVRSHGGYTPLHLAAQHGHQTAFDLLVQAYKADANLRDYAGKRPRQYMMQADNNSTISLSNHTFRQLKDRRRTRTSKQQTGGMLRFGSLSVKVKKTTEAFNNYFNNNQDTGSKRWTPAANNSDAQKMPPPKFAPIKKRKNSKRGIDFGGLAGSRSTPGTPSERALPAVPAIPEERSGASDNSDSEFGFGNTWSNA